MRLSELFVRRPVTTGMFLLAIALFGLMSLAGLGLELYPELQLPFITVATLYPSADPQTVEAEVTHAVEGVLATASGLRRVDSVSMENVSLVFAEFAWGTPLEETIAELRARLSLLSLTLPSEAQAPVVLRIDPNQFPTLMIGVSGDDDLLAATDAALDVVRPRLERVPGVAQVAVLGGVEREIQVLYDSAKLRENGLTPAHLQQFLSLQNAMVPAGVIEHNGRRYQTRVGSHFTSVQEIRDLVIGESRLPVEGLAALWPPLLHVKDVAQVVDGVKDPAGYARMNGRPTVILQVYKQAGANTVAVADGVRAALQELETAMPGFTLSVITDQSTSIRQSLESLVVFGVIGAGVVVAVLFVFLRSWRGLLIVALSIPLSALLTLIALYASNMSLNLMTLGGLALGTGMVVDNAIIVVENIFRRRSQGHDPETASILGAQEITGAIVGATITTMAVFLPAAFMDTFAGQLFKELGITVSFALGASLLIALTVVPSLAARLFRVSLPPVTAAWDSGRLVRWYIPLLERALARRDIIFLATALLVAATIALVPHLGTEFLPDMYKRVLYVTLEMPPGTPLAHTDAVAREAEARLAALPAVEHVAAQVGEQRQEDIVSLLGDYGANTIQLLAFLREAASPDDAPALTDSIEAALADLPARRLAVSDAWSSSSNLFASTIVLQVSGPELETLQRIAGELQNRLSASPYVSDVHVPYSSVQPELFFAVNQSRALIGGLTTAQVSLAVRNALTGIQVTQVRDNGRTIPVVMRPQPSETEDLTRLLNYPVTSPVVVSLDEPASVRLGNVVNVAEGTAPQAIRRIDGMRAVEVEVLPAGADLATTFAAVNEAIADLELPAGYEIRTGGIRQLIDESLGDLAAVLIWSVVLVYVVLAAQFESWRHPLIIMVTVPMAGMGSIWALWLAGEKLGVASLIGLIMLGGIAVNNGIVLVDRFLQLVRGGMDAPGAALEAARDRLRPVIMTALTTISGMIPMAVSRGEGTEFQVPVSLAVIGGLTTATVLTLFVVPALCVAAAGRGFRDRRPPRAGAKAGIAGLLLAVILLSPGQAGAQGGGGWQWTVGVGYPAGDVEPLYLAGTGWGARTGDWRWLMQLQGAATADGAPAAISLDGSAQWFQPVSLFGYYQVDAHLTLRQLGTDPLRSFFSLRGEGVLGNVTGTVEMDAVVPGFPIWPWDAPRRMALAGAGNGRWHVRAELRQQPNRELNLIREFQWAKPRYPIGAPGAAVLAGGAELRAGSGWLLGKAGIKLAAGGWQPVLAAGYRFRPSAYSQFSIAASSATAFSDQPAVSVRYELLTDDAAYTTGLDVALGPEGRLLPALVIQGEPHAGGWRWQLTVGTSEDARAAGGFAITF